jgi:hypothetical protein
MRPKKGKNEKPGVIMDMTIKTLAFLTVAWGILISCEPFSSETTITLSLPQFPDQWACLDGEIVFTIMYQGRGSAIEAVESYWGASNVTIHIPKRINTPVLGIPSIRGFELLPCGCVLPLDATGTWGEEACLAWEHGCVASILMTLAEKGLDISMINIDKLAREIEEKAPSADPWRLDMAQICERLSSGGFATYYIDPLPARTIELDPIEGAWCSEDPFAGLSYADEDGTLLIPDCTYGFHRFFSIDSKEILDVQVSGEESRWIRYAY